ncbi:hypothetical protein CEK25_005974 [Fusarium fujikuroi]|nr:hypothetical protein CEK25_005974 [Fusarium fujikuroi]
MLEDAAGQKEQRTAMMEDAKVHRCKGLGKKTKMGLTGRGLSRKREDGDDRGGIGLDNESETKNQRSSWLERDIKRKIRRVSRAREIKSARMHLEKHCEPVSARREDGRLEKQNQTDMDLSSQYQILKTQRRSQERDRRMRYQSAIAGYQHTKTKEDADDEGTRKGSTVYRYRQDTKKTRKLQTSSMI